MYYVCDQIYESFRDFCSVPVGASRLKRNPCRVEKVLLGLYVRRLIDVWGILNLVLSEARTFDKKQNIFLFFLSCPKGLLQINLPAGKITNYVLKVHFLFLEEYCITFGP